MNKAPAVIESIITNYKLDLEVSEKFELVLKQIRMIEEYQNESMRNSHVIQLILDKGNTDNFVFLYQRIRGISHFNPDDNTIYLNIDDNHISFNHSDKQFSVRSYKYSDTLDLLNEQFIKYST